MTQSISLQDKFTLIDGYFTPKIIAELNGQYVKLAKFLGEFDWHSHADEDEYFQVVAGQFDMHFRDKVVTVKAGECIVVPRGVEHRPVAETEAHVMMFEPKATRQTGDTVTERTVDISDQNWI